MFSVFMTKIGTKIGGYLAATIGALLLLLGIYNKVKNKGRKEVVDEVNAKTTETVIDTVKKEKAIVEEIKSVSPDTRRDRLRKYASDRDDK